MLTKQIQNSSFSQATQTYDNNLVLNSNPFRDSEFEITIAERNMYQTLSLGPYHLLVAITNDSKFQFCTIAASVSDDFH